MCSLHPVFIEFVRACKIIAHLFRARVNCCDLQTVKQKSLNLRQFSTRPNFKLNAIIEELYAANKNAAPQS